MRLSRIEAVHYGALEQACLEGLSEGLTVVLGPNESGKTTFTALTRHVLYGYPDARTTERGYSPAAGARDARLIFSSEEGEWSIARADGPRGGPLTVSALRGAERPALASEIVGGVSKESFQVVFAFGLDDLAKIERGGPDDIVGRLHAAGTGLEVNPMDVRRALEQRAASLYAPRASKPLINSLATQIRDVKARIRELEAQAAEFVGEQQHMRELAEQLSALETERDELDVGRRTLERDAQRAVDAADQLNAAAAERADLDARIADAETGIGLVDVDERVLAAAPDLSAVLAQEPVFQERLERAGVSDAAAEEARRAAAAAPDLPAAARDSVENRTAVESWRTTLMRLDAEMGTAARAAEQAEARLAGSQAAARAPEVAHGRPAAVIAAAIVAALAGAGLVALGLVGGQTAAIIAGGAVGAAAVVALAIALAGRPRPSASPLDAEIAAQRSEASTAGSLAATAQAKREAAYGEWRAWLTERELDAFGDDPVAVIGLLDALREREKASVEVEHCLEDAKRERQAAEDWVVRLVDVASRFDESAAQIPALSVAAELAARAKAALDRARSREAERLDLTRALDTLRADRARVTRSVEAQGAMLAHLGAGHGIGEGDPVPALLSLGASAAEQLEDLRSRVEDVTGSASELRYKLNGEGRDDEMARARQQLEGLGAQAAAAADRYLVDALAVRLLDRARERFELERQPQVVRTAARVFSAMTQGRYTDVRMPLGGSEIVVIGENRTAHAAAQLSRGTAEQLYLALRVGLIASLGELGRWLPVLMDDVIVNFDPERRQGAVAAVAELAATRQVLFFTCHPDTAELLAERVPGTALVHIDRCELRG